MSEATERQPWEHDNAFRRRRAMNWVPLGMTYALLYTARYNFTVANVSIACERHWGIGEISKFITVGLAVYAFSTFLNGPLADRVGGRKAILAAAAGAALCNFLFPAIAATAPIAVLLVLWGLNGYFQSFGALSVVKVNAAWFHVRERGSFSGIFGTMIQSGRWIVLSLGGFLLAQLGWRSLYNLPAIALTIMFVVNFLLVRDAPEDAGLARLETGDESASEREQPTTLRFVLRKIFTSKIAWLIAAANFCTGFVRHGIEQYWRVFFGNVYHVDTKSLPYQFVANIGFVAGVVGAMTAGVVSDRFFGSRRGPVASIWYMGQVLLLVAFALIVPAVPAVMQQHGVSCAAPRPDDAARVLLAVMLAVTAALVAINFVVANTRSDARLVWFGVQLVAIIAMAGVWRHLGGMFTRTAHVALASVIIVLLQFFIGGAHGLLAGTASMDYGGRKAAATAAGFFDGVQYLAGSVGGLMLGAALKDKGWSWWIPGIAPFALIGAAIMATLWRAMPSGASAKGAH
jgi:OPA family glycerol-3-phosphate transporter-like MFS transporter